MTLLLEALGSIARWLLAGLMGYFVGHGVFTQAQADNYTTALAGAAAAIRRDGPIFGGGGRVRRSRRWRASRRGRGIASRGGSTRRPGLGRQ